MSSRDAILEAVRRSQPVPLELPDVPDQPRPDGELVEQFARAVRAIGGGIIDGTACSLDAAIAQRYPEAAQVASTIAGVTAAGFSLASVSDPHGLAGLDLLVCEGEFGVAENGAVWLAEPGLGHRAAPFIAQHVLLRLDRRQLVWSMHEAYARLHVDAAGFGLFVAGPSKTADIEQALVIGAHGPRSFTVVLT
jgi:L-lactate dehydrogenase complex protein LldG